MKILKPIFILIVIVNIYYLGYSQSATYKETMVNMKTYPFSEPNPVADMGTVYPYFRFDGFSATSVDKPLKMIELENDYIKLWITPEIGGKIWGAIEKSTGKEFIYFNHSVKFRDIAMRGPWTSGGLELNFGIIGHAPTTSNPVDYTVRKNTDGSVSCFLGAIDLGSRTRWSVEVWLPADKAYFVTRSKWDNSTVYEQSYYQWMNVGVKSAGNLEYIYPGKNYLGHDGKAFSYPKDEKGREISWYEKNNFGPYKSYHVFGSYTDFFGGYWHNDDFGFGHYSNFDDKPGKKIWIWGLSPQGMIWEDLLTDKDGQYTEIQSGRLFNQEAQESTITPFKHRGFAPSTTDLFNEYWFPVNATKGLKNALPDASVNFTNENGKLMLRICPNSKLDAKIEVRIANNVIFTKQIQMVPQKAMAFPIDSKSDASECSVWLNGQLFYDANPAHSYTKRPTESPSDMNWNSAYGHYLLGKEFERQRLYQKSNDEYEKCLSIESSFVPALSGMSQIKFRNADYRKSLEYALKALSVDTYDGTANYYYGLSSLALGDTISAMDGLSIASASMNYRSAAYNELASIHLSKKNYSKALEYAQKSLLYNAEGSKAHQLEIIALRLLNRSKNAEEKLALIESSDPLNHFIRFEKYIVNPTTQNAQEISKYITNEFPFQTYLEYAIFCHSIQQDDAAIKILQLSPSSVEVNYWLAYLSHLKNNETEANKYLDKALSESPYLVFPYRNESQLVLDWALKAKNNWKTKYYLALIELVHLNSDMAISLLKDCQNQPDFYPFYIVRARLIKKSDATEAAKDLELALQYGKDQWQVGRMVANLYGDLGKTEQALAISKNYYTLYPSNYYLGLQYAGFLNKLNQYSASLEILKKVNVLPNEGATAGWVAWRNSNLNMAVDCYKKGKYSDAIKFVDAARQFPKNLGVGKTYVTDERIEDFIASLCYTKMKKQTEAVSFENKIIATITDRQDEILWNSGDLITAQLLKKQNKKEEAVKLIEELKKENPESPNIKWCKAIFEGNYSEAERISKEQVGQTNKDQSFQILLRLQNEMGVFNQ